MAKAAGENRTAKIPATVEAVGEHSFGVLLLVPGLLVLSPLSGIPGLSRVFALMMLIGRDCSWLPW